MYLGVDFGTTHLKGCLIDEDGVVLAKKSTRYETQKSSRANAWRDAFLGIAGEVLSLANVTSVNAVCVSAMAPNVLIEGSKTGFGEAILFHEDTAFVTEQRLDNELGSVPWANEVLSKLIVLNENLGKEEGRWFSTHNYIVHWLTGGNYYLDYPVATECGTIWDHGEWSTSVLNEFSLENLAMPQLASPMTQVGFVGSPDARRILGDDCAVVMGSSDTIATLTGLGIDPGERLFYYGSFNSATQVKVPLSSLLTRPQASAPFDWYCSLPLSGEQVRSTVELLEGAQAFDTFWEKAALSPIGANGVRFVHTPWGVNSTVSTVPRGSFFNVPIDVSAGDVARAVGESFGFAMRAFADAAGLPSTGGTAVVAGGGAGVRVWRQMVSDITGFTQRRIRDADFGLGSALIAMGGVLGIESMERAVLSHKAQSEITIPHEASVLAYESEYIDYRKVFGWGES